MGDLKFGWHMASLPVDGSSATAFIGQLHDMLEQIQPQFDSVWVDDHVMPRLPGIDNDTPFLECFTTIAALATAHPKLMFASGMACQSYRNPALLAKMAANIQALTSGRFILGIGAGWMLEDYQTYNWDFPSAAVRIEQMEETIEIAKALWSQPAATFTGKHYRIENAYCSPRPDPIPPIMIGGGGEQKTLRAVAKYADMWNLPGGTLETYAHKLEVLRQRCQEVGRDYASIIKTWSPEAIAIAATEEEAQRIATNSPYKQDVFIGTPAQIVKELQPFINLGVERLIIRLIDFPSPAGMELFIKEVIPALRQ